MAALGFEADVNMEDISRNLEMSMEPGVRPPYGDKETRQ